METLSFKLISESCETGQQTVKWIWRQMSQLSIKYKTEALGNPTPAIVSSYKVMWSKIRLLPSLEHEQHTVLYTPQHVCCLLKTSKRTRHTCSSVTNPVPVFNTITLPILSLSRRKASIPPSVMLFSSLWAVSVYLICCCPLGSKTAAVLKLMQLAWQLNFTEHI